MIFLFFVLLVNLPFFGQEKCFEMKVKNDEVTASTTISSDTIEISGLLVKITAGTRKDSYPKILFQVKDACIDEYSPIFILFESGKRIKSTNFVYAHNCDGQTGFIINKSQNEKLLLTDKIKTIRIDTRGNYLQVDLTTEQADKLQRALKCSFNRNSWQSEIKYKGSW